MSILCARGRGHANFTRVCVAGDHLPPSKHICITFYTMLDQRRRRWADVV